MTREKLYKFYIDDLGFCECGNPAKALRALRDYLKSAETESRWKLDDGPSLLVAYFCDAANLTEHGGSVYGAWLSQLGKDVAKALDEYGCDPADWGCYGENGWENPPESASSNALDGP